MIYAVTALGVLAAVQAFLSWKLARRLDAVHQFDERMRRLAEAVALLTDTTESGFRTLSDQVLAPSAKPAPKRSRPAAATTRMVRAARKGTPIADIAAAEQVAQGEVRLRLHLADTLAAETAQGGSHGALRVD